MRGHAGRDQHERKPAELYTAKSTITRLGISASLTAATDLPPRTSDELCYHFATQFGSSGQTRHTGTENSPDISTLAGQNKT
jgi:hypothetical protein